MPTIYLAQPESNADLTRESSAMEQLWEMLEQQAGIAGLECVQVVSQTGADRPWDAGDAVLLQAKICGQQNAAYAGTIRYAQVDAEHFALARQLAAYLQEFCTNFVQVAPLQGLPSTVGKPAILQLEIWGRQPWFIEEICSIARAMLQAIHTYFLHLQAQEQMQVATIESPCDTQAIYQYPAEGTVVVAQVGCGEQVCVRKKMQDWLHVDCGTNEGYIPKQFVTLHYPISP